MPWKNKRSLEQNFGGLRSDYILIETHVIHKHKRSESISIRFIASWRRDSKCTLPQGTANTAPSLGLSV